jgi:CBS domain-containing protein
MRVRDLMSQPAVTCHVNDTASTAAHLMRDHDCGMIVIVRDDGQLAGVVTDRDLCMAAFTQGRPLDEILVNSVMAQHVVTATPELKIIEAEQRMADHRVRRLPVVDGDGKPIGVIAVSDLAIECVQPDTPMRYGPLEIAHTLAAICEHRTDTVSA